jgi:hypothetical protein
LVDAAFAVVDAALSLMSIVVQSQSSRRSKLTSAADSTTTSHNPTQSM